MIDILKYRSKSQEFERFKKIITANLRKLRIKPSQ